MQDKINVLPWIWTFEWHIYKWHIFLSGLKIVTPENKDTYLNIFPLIIMKYFHTEPCTEFKTLKELNLRGHQSAQEYSSLRI